MIMMTMPLIEIYHDEIIVFLSGLTIKTIIVPSLVTVSVKKRVPCSLASFKATLTLSVTRGFER